MIREFAAFVAGRAGLTVGTNLFVGWHPQSAPVAFDVIQEYGGAPSFDLPEHWEAAIQITSRASSYQAARARAYAIYEAIARKTIWTMPAAVSGGRAYLAVIEANAIPQYLGQDGDAPNAPFLFVVNYTVRVERTA